MSVGTVVTAPPQHDPGEDSLIRNVSIMASAGSGKTFQLSNRFIQLILLGAKPESILASTFTRLAAGEIRDRILQRLAKAAQNEKERRDLATALGCRDISHERIVESLSTLTCNLHRLQVRTLDSFFAQVVRCFALELGIDPAADIVDADLDAQMRSEAIELMLDERDPQPLIDLLRVLSEGGESRRVTEVIDGEMRSLYELYREAPPHAWEAVDFWKPLDPDALQEAVERLCATPSSENGHHVNAHRGDCDRARAARPANADEWNEFLSKGLACAILHKDGVFQRKVVPPDVVDAYKPLIDHAKAVIRNAIAARTRSTRDLLERFHLRYEEAKAKHKALTFADITAKMAAVFVGQDSSCRRPGPAGDTRQDKFCPTSADEICFRLDATLRHLLLDEMQDTSVQQWRALTEIVRNIISEAPPQRSFFCVGDVKQSIYGWREACPEILAQMPALLRDLGGEAEPQTLPQNWRSSRIVLQTVDRVFIDTRSNAALESLPAAVHEWAGEYEPHEPKRDLPGYAELRTSRFADKSLGDSQALVRLSDAADLIANFARESPHHSIGVLTRTNETVSCLLYELGPAGRNVDAAGRGGGSLTDSAPVNAVLDLLRLADHPDHTIAAFNVIHSPLGQAIDFTHLDDRTRIARDVRRSLLEDGYAKTVGEWIRVIGSRTGPRELRRLIQLQELAASFDPRATLRADDFLALVDATIVPDVGGDSSGGGYGAGSGGGSGGPQVQVMTIHQSKGLEFDIVVLPDLDQAITRTNGMKIVTERDSCGNVTRIARHLSKDALALFDDLEPMYDQQIARMARDSMCSLYVAMTRARHALHMVINPSAPNERSIPKTLAGVLRCALVGSAQIEPESTLFQHGDPAWHESLPAAGIIPESSSQIAPTAIDLAPAGGAIPRGRAAIAASELHDDSSSPRTRFAPSLRIDDGGSRDRGTAIHAMFEQIEWIEDFIPDRERLMRIAMDIAPRRGEAWAIEQVDSFLRMINRGPVRDALSRRSLRETASVRREMRFARLIDGAIQSGIIDRLAMEFDDEGRCARAVILDYKTGAIDAEFTADRAKRYRGQLEAYRAAAASMLGIDKSCIEAKLLFVTSGEVTDLTPD